jgi:GxxExxY protein
MTEHDSSNATRSWSRGAESTQKRLLHGDVTHAILGAFYRAHTELGAGFLEGVYANGVAVLLRIGGLRVDREVQYDVYFHGYRIGRYRADMVVESKVVVEVKAGRAVSAQNAAQLRNYLRASGIPVGLLLNFGHKATFERVIATTGYGRACPARKDTQFTPPNSAQQNDGTTRCDDPQGSPREVTTIPVDTPSARDS